MSVLEEQLFLRPVGLAHLRDLLWGSSCRNRHRNLPCTRRQRRWGGLGLCAEGFCGRFSRGKRGGLREEGWAQLWSSLSLAVFLPRWQHTATFIVCVKAGALECLFLWCFLLLMIQSLSHTGRHYAKGETMPKWVSMPLFRKQVSLAQNILACIVCVCGWRLQLLRRSNRLLGCCYVDSSCQVSKKNLDIWSPL